MKTINPEVEMSAVSICTRCGELTGSLRVRGEDYELMCGCVPRKNRAESRTPPGYDFLPIIDLCFCCGLTPIESGSRWSQFFCDDCRKPVVSLNERFGVTVIPIGRHSMMNSVALKGTGIHDKAKVREFMEDINLLFFRIGVVHDWRGLIVRRNLASLHMEDDEAVPLAKYLKRVNAPHRRLEKAKAFRKLAALMEVPDWYFMDMKWDPTLSK